MAKATVVFEQVDSGWRAKAGDTEVRGRSLREAQRKIRPLIATNGAKVTEEIRLPGSARKHLDRYAAARTRAQVETAALRKATRAVVSMLTGKHGVSLRDASTLIGLSRERIRQLAS